MIISRVQIENYKQYTGCHDIVFPYDALVGVIGDNGTGKTTLFEAIEWCLYSPRSISPADIRPRGLTGNTTVTIWLETGGNREQYVIQRVLRKSITAMIFRIEPSGDMTKVVDGTRQVTEYVATTLIGLSHAAFTASFFTRQKELHLFGSEAPAKRREAIGRMLGLETIRIARRTMMDERQQLLADAKATKTQYERESVGHDFDRELANADHAISGFEAELSTAATARAAAGVEITRVESSLAAAQRRRELFHTLSNQLKSRERENQASQTRLKQIQDSLSRLQRRAGERSERTAVAQRLPALCKELEIQEQEKQRFDRKSELERQLDQYQERRRNRVDEVASTVRGVSPRATVTGWTWDYDDDLAPIERIDRLLTTIDSLDAVAAEQRESDLRHCRDASVQTEKEKQTLNAFLQRQAKLHQTVQSLLAEGDPTLAIQQIDREKEAAQQRRTALATDSTHIQGERDRSRMLLRNLKEQQFGDDCPTCGRPFSEADAEIVMLAIEERIAGASEAITARQVEIKRVTNEIAALEAARKRAAEKDQLLNDARSRLATSDTYIQDQQHRVETLERQLTEALTQARLTNRPSEEQIEEAALFTRDLLAMKNSRSSIVNSQRDLASLQESISAIRQELPSLADARFDDVAYRRLQHQVQLATTAVAEVAQIDRDLAQQPALVNDRTTQEAELQNLGVELARLQQEIDALAFEPDEVTTTQATLTQLRSQSQSLQDGFYRLQGNLQQAGLMRQQIVRERKRLRDLATQADRLQKHAEELDLMTREMMEFERFAGERKVPVLNDTTSSLVEEITGGKYQRVEFDQDFGIRVFDNSDVEESFPVETFSGGERDAIILAARLALSRMIGQQAANPPGFLVLDEVFGSLDADRRAQVLNLLGSITSIFEDLRQVFIISHVDDVRTSSVLDEIWRVEENPEGGSRVTTLGSGADLSSG